MPEVVALAGTLANAGEHRHAAVHRANVADEFLDDDGFAHTGPAVSADLAALGEGRNQVEHLDARFQDLHGGVLVVEGWRVAVNGPELAGFHRPQVVQGSAGNVEEAAQGFRAHRHGHLVAGIVDFRPSGQPVGGTEGETAGPVVADVLLHFQHEALSGVVHFQGVK